MSARILITGGSGYFGTVLTQRAIAAGNQVRIFDLNPPSNELFDANDVDYVSGDIRDRNAIRDACDGMDVLLHNVAQVPLAKDRDLFESVNVTGTANMLVAARDAGVSKVVHTSTSAVYGIPKQNPVTEQTPPSPVEDYGRAKLVGELLCADAVAAGLDVTIVRPRTIMGHGRLGIMAMLFDLIAEGAPIPLLGKGDNRYQFVHSDDLADATLAAALRDGPTSYNVGAKEFGTLRETLQPLIDHAGTGSRIQPLPLSAARAAMKAASLAHLVPLAPYHWLLYGESLYFDTAKAERELDYQPKFSNASMMIESYDWYMSHRAGLDGSTGSAHQSPARLGALKVLKYVP